MYSLKSFSLQTGSESRSASGDSVLVPPGQCETHITGAMKGTMDETGKQRILRWVELDTLSVNSIIDDYSAHQQRVSYYLSPSVNNIYFIKIMWHIYLPMCQIITDRVHCIIYTQGMLSCWCSKSFPLTEIMQPLSCWAAAFWPPWRLHWSFTIFDLPSRKRAWNY